MTKGLQKERELCISNCLKTSPKITSIIQSRLKHNNQAKKVSGKKVMFILSTLQERKTQYSVGIFV